MKYFLVILLSVLYVVTYAQKKYDSYKGLAMAGYQGWFSCPNDGSDRGWYHYLGRDGQFRPGSCKIDMWPDISEYDQIYRTEFMFADGKPAYLMSSYDESTVNTHFRWMREYDIDGVFVQRFVAEIKRPKSYRQLNKVWNSAINAANANNRAISIMYDLSGMIPGDEVLILNDIDAICEKYDIRERVNNSSYLHHNGKPLVAVWGVGFNDNRKYGFKEAEIIINALIERGFSIMLGVPTNWRKMEGDALGDPKLHRLIKKCDIVMPWFVGRYNEESFSRYEKFVKDDIQWCKENKLDYAPLAFPGFSWKNMHKDSTPIPRNRGSFYWKQLSTHINLGAEMLYIAMFDEIDEGTAIFKCATKVPVGESYFLPLDTDLGSDYYLYLTGQASKMLRKEIPFTKEIPQNGITTYRKIFAPHEGLINKTEKEYRREICLNGLWDFQAVELPKGYVQGNGTAPELPLPVANAWDKTKIKVPSPWNINSFAYRDLEGPDHRNYPSYPKSWEDVKMAWMRKTITIPSDWAGRQIKLYFEAVAGFTEVYVNRQKVGENFDLFLPFDMDITRATIPGETVEILVGVKSQSLFEDRSTVGRRIIPAGSMWGYHISGIWQDVFLVALPEINVKDMYVKPLVSKNLLELEVTVQNNTKKKADVQLSGVINEWINKAGADVDYAPVPNWELGTKALDIAATKLIIAAGGESKTTIQIPVKESDLAYWTPEHPNLYSLRLFVNDKKQTIDIKYERFGWREWTFQGAKQCLNGKPIELKGDSWHFMGIPQMTRRYAWAWFTAIKGMNGNAVRPHAQIYPRFYLDVADEMGICVLNETANWASDGGPKLDSDKFWEASKRHLERFVLRDRNHASIFGWSISNENKPVILHVYNKPELMSYQKQAWEDWRNIVMENDPTRPWISADGEDDGDGILPATVGHYGDLNSMKHWAETGKPWGIGEHSMAYYGTPEQVSKYNGEEAYTSQYGRMKGLANECYNLIANQRKMGASYVSVFNMAWYALQPLPIGKKDVTTIPSLTEDGIFFPNYTEGVPGVQPERMGPYCTTFNPGYDPSLPLYMPWPMYEAMRAANAPGQPAWSPYMDIGKKSNTDVPAAPVKTYKEVMFAGNEDSSLKQIMDAQGVKFVTTVKNPQQLLYIVDGTHIPTDADEKKLLQNLTKGADIWIWGLVPQTINAYNEILPLSLTLEKRNISSFIPEQKSWMKGLNNSDFYFCEIQRTNASEYGLSGAFVDEGEVLLNACNTDWRKWNKRPEELKTAATVRSENEQKGAAPTFVKYQSGISTYYVSTLTEFANSEKGYNTLAGILKQAGIPCRTTGTNTADVFFLRDNNLHFPISTREKFRKEANEYIVDYWVFSPRPLNDLLIEPDMPKLTLYVDTWQSVLLLNDKPYGAANKTNRNSTYKELPLLQGWNKVTLRIGTEDRNRFNATFSCENNLAFLSQLKVSFTNPEVK